jgi:hypothetical protein
VVSLFGPLLTVIGGLIFVAFTSLGMENSLQVNMGCEKTKGGKIFFSLESM